MCIRDSFLFRFLKIFFTLTSSRWSDSRKKSLVRVGQIPDDIFPPMFVGQIIGFFTHICWSDSRKYFSPISLIQIPEHTFHPYSLVRFLNIFFIHIRRSDSWKYLSPISVGQIPENIFHPYLLVGFPKICLFPLVDSLFSLVDGLFS